MIKVWVGLAREVFFKVMHDFMAHKEIPFGRMTVICLSLRISFGRTALVKVVSVWPEQQQIFPINLVVIFELVKFPIKVGSQNRPVSD